MNLLKNLMILAVLAVAGYVVYVSLARNDADPSPPPGVAEPWPTAPNVMLSSNVKSPPGPADTLASGGNAPAPSGGLRLGSSGAPPLPSSSPILAVPPTPVNQPLAGVPAPISPYPSSPTPPPVSSPPAIPLTAPSTSPQSDPLASAAPPIPPMTAGTDQVRNLAPPPSGQASMPEALAPLAPVQAPATGRVPPPAESQATALLHSQFTAFMDAVQKKLDEEKFAEVQVALSALYGNSDLPPEQASQVTALLDQLAGTVIYSRKHHLEPPYVVQQGDTLDRIAKKYSIPWLLLARINGLMPPNDSNPDSPIKDQPLPPRRELKVVRGPFDAVIHRDTHELTLMLQHRYAGRFPIGVGRDQPTLDGEYTVREKSLHPAYYGPDGVTIPPDDPKNPLGWAWIGLTDRIGIHGTNDPRAVGREDNRGAICVADKDLQDLYGILSVGSRVTIQR